MLPNPARWGVGDRSLGGAGSQSVRTGAYGNHTQREGGQAQRVWQVSGVAGSGEPDHHPLRGVPGAAQRPTPAASRGGSASPQVGPGSWMGGGRRRFLLAGQ